MITYGLCLWFNNYTQLCNILNLIHQAIKLTSS